MNKKIVFPIILIISLIAGIAGPAMAQYIMQSNHLSHSSSAQAIIAISQNSTTSIVGVDTVQLIATEPSITTGTTVTFYDGATVIGTSLATGTTAVFNFPIVTAKTWDFHATALHP